MLTFTQQLANKAAYERAKAAQRPVTATVTGKRPKWAFKVLAYVATPQGAKVEVFDDYTFAGKWTKALGGGVVYPVSLIADYTSSSVTLKEGMQLHEPEPTIAELAAEVDALYFGA